MERRASLSSAAEIERTKVRRKKFVESIMEGVPASEVRDELNANAARRKELKAKLATFKSTRQLATACKRLVLSGLESGNCGGGI